MRARRQGLTPHPTDPTHQWPSLSSPPSHPHGCGNGAAPPPVSPMSETFNQRASALRARARQERDHGRAWYLRGLAASYEALAECRGEPAPPVRPPRPSPPALIERAGQAALLRGQGYTQRQIAERLNVSQARVWKMLQELD
jgi:hypothetical protein